jgi:spermidine synthase
MLPTEVVAEARAPDGSLLTLRRRGSEWLVFSGGIVLMSSRQHYSEEVMAREALARAAGRGRILVGGLGLGFTLRAILDAASSTTQVQVVELFSALVDWNILHFGELARAPLSDARVSVEIADVGAVIARELAAWDVILLDVDNGPEALSQPSNASLYGSAGLVRAKRALRPGGCLAVWSGGPSPAFEVRLRQAGFVTETLQVRAHPSGGSRHTLFFGTLTTERGR